MAEIHSFEGLAEYAQQQIERVERMQRDLAAQVGEGTSRQGHVKATTGPAGILNDLDIAPAALRMTPEELAAEVKSAVGAAQAQYAERADDIMGPILNARPSEDANSAIEAGMARLESLTADLDRIARTRGLNG